MATSNGSTIQARRRGVAPENMRDPLQVASLVLQIKQAVGLGTALSDPPVILVADSESDLHACWRATPRRFRSRRSPPGRRAAALAPPDGRPVSRILGPALEAD